MKNLNSHAAFEADFKAFLDGELPLGRRFQVRRHIRNCPHCRKEIRIMQTIETELKTEETVPMSADLRAKILETAPMETSADAPKPTARLVPQMTFGFASLAVFAALISYPAYQGFREYQIGASKQSAAKQAGLDRQIYAQNDSQSPEPMAGDARSVPSEAGEKAASGSAGAASAPLSVPSGEPLTNEQLANKSLAKVPAAILPGDDVATGGALRARRGLSNPSGYGSGIYLENAVPAQRQVHKQGSISVTVDDAEAKGSATEILVKNVGGFVAQNALSTGGDGRKTATLDVRVPVTQFEAIVTKIGKLGAVREKSINGEDITQRVTVAGAQRQSLSRELSIREAQLQSLSSKKVAERAGIVSDVRNLRFQANQARAQLEYLQKYAALATIFVTLQDKPKVAAVAGPTSELSETARVAWSSFLVSARVPVQLLIWVLAYAPLWLPALILWRKFARKLVSAG